MIGAWQIGGERIAPGERRRLEIPVARLSTGTWLSLPLEVINGHREGPRLWLSAAVHGDEINGVEIIRRVLEKIDPAKLSGGVIAAPIVNVFGFVSQQRYLPDRRDLNRCFPGSARGSTASRLAHLFMTEVVGRCSYGVDLHTAAAHRVNLPQVRGNLKDPETRRCAEAFGAPVMMHAASRDGSIREAATRRGIHVLLYEAGEPLRFDEHSISVGVKGILRLLNALKMRTTKKRSERRNHTIEVADSTWVRARRGGVVRLSVMLGQRVERKQLLCTISDAFGEAPAKVTAPHDGIVIGMCINPLVNQGDGLVHLAKEVEHE